MSGSWMGIGAAALVLATGVAWFRLLRTVRIPENRTLYLLAMALGAALGSAALFREPGWLGGLAAVLAVVGGGLFLGLRLQSRQDARVPAVKVGGPILDFHAADENGAVFDLATLRGKPFLLKFFRGHW
jgi:hypothetical protein